MHVCSIRCFAGQPTRIKFCSKTFSIGRKRILPIEVPYRRPRVLRVIGSEDKGNSLSNNDLNGKQQKTEVERTEQDINTESPKRPPQILIRILQFIGLITKGLASLFKRRIVRLIFFLMCIAGGRLVFNSTRAYDVNVMYSEFVKQVDSGMVETVFFESKSNNVRFTYNPKMWTNLKEKLMTTYRLSDVEAEKRINRIRTKSKVVPGQTESLTQLLQKKQIRYGVAEQPMSSAVSSFIWTIAILWIPILPLIYLLRRSMDSRLGGSKGKKAKTASAQIKVKFNDVAGMEEAKAELLEVVNLLKNPNKYSKLNVKIPSGVLLCGPTGTGKTLLARAVAGEAGVAFFAVSASEFVEMFVGRGAARIRELFKEARKHAPCVVFIDEIDSVGGVRGNSFNEERDQTLNQLLVELDGFEDNHSIVLLAATNRFNSLDPALLRPGRLTRKIKIPLPDLVGRAAILAVHLRDVPMEDLQEKIDACNFIAKISIGFSGAELANTVNEAALMAARDDRDFIRIEDLIRGLQRTKQPVNDSTVAPVWFRSFQQFIIEQSWRNARLQLPP